MGKVELTIQGTQCLYIYRPQVDLMTTAEVARIVEIFSFGMMVLMRMMAPEQFDELFAGAPDGVKRHFVIEPIASSTGSGRRFSSRPATLQR